MASPDEYVKDAGTIALAHPGEGAAERVLDAAAADETKRFTAAENGFADAQENHRDSTTTITDLEHRATTLIAGFAKSNAAIADKVRNNTRFSLTAPAAERANQEAQILVLSDSIELQKATVATLATAVTRAEYNLLVAQRSMLAAHAMVEALRVYRQVEALKQIDPAAKIDYTIGHLADLSAQVSELNLEIIRKQKEIL